MEKAKYLGNLEKKQATSWKSLKSKWRLNIAYKYFDKNMD